MKPTLIALTASFTLIATPMLAADDVKLITDDNTKKCVDASSSSASLGGVAAADDVKLTTDDDTKKCAYASSSSASPGGVAAAIIGGLLVIGLAAGSGSGGSAGGTN